LIPKRTEAAAVDAGDMVFRFTTKEGNERNEKIKRGK
jgi:hypothetical protein